VYKEVSREKAMKAMFQNIKFVRRSFWTVQTYFYGLPLNRTAFFTPAAGGKKA